MQSDVRRTEMNAKEKYEIFSLISIGKDSFHSFPFWFRVERGYRFCFTLKMGNYCFYRANNPRENMVAIFTEWWSSRWSSAHNSCAKQTLHTLLSRINLNEWYCSERRVHVLPLDLRRCPFFFVTGSRNTICVHVARSRWDDSVDGTPFSSAWRLSLLAWLPDARGITSLESRMPEIMQYLKYVYDSESRLKAYALCVLSIHSRTRTPDLQVCNDDVWWTAIERTWWMRYV